MPWEKLPSKEERARILSGAAARLVPIYGHMPKPWDPEHCTVCGAELSELQMEIAWNDHREMECSPECRLKDLVRRHACCEKAQPMNCVCMYAFSCPEHGERHIGTHD